MITHLMLVGAHGLGLAALVVQPSPHDPYLTGIVPHPAEMSRMDGALSVTDLKNIFWSPPADESVRATAAYLAEVLGPWTGGRLTVQPATGRDLEPGSILLTTTDSDAAMGREGYALTISPDSVRLQAGHPPGLFYGVQTLRQLLPVAEPGGERRSTQPATLPALRIVDQPRYAWRGMLLDCCRHFMTTDYVKRTIDLLAYHKMNVLHWHLTEDQGWRIEIKKYPKLTEVGAWRGSGDQRHGGYYTQQDIREIVEYARRRHVTVVPEIEMPGHALAALAAYPELSCTGGPFEVSTRWGVHADVYCAGNDKTFAFLEDVLDEVLELFPSQYIHIGGDECPKTRWKQCPKCQARIRDQKLADEHELQSYFIRRIETYLNGRGRDLIGWDEILEGGLAPNATVQSWRGMNGAIQAARSGHRVIASPTSHCYLDYSHTQTSLETTYSFEPTPAELSPEQQRFILGAEGNMWTEHAPQQRVDRQVFPRLCALAEVTWTPRQHRRWDDFARRMKTHYRRLDAMGVAYYLEPPRCTSPRTVFTDSVEVILQNPFDGGAIHYTRDGSTPTASSEQYSGPVRLTDTATVTACTILPGGRASEVAAYTFRKQRPLAPVAVSDVRGGLGYAYYEGHWRQLPDFDRLEPVATGRTADFDIGVRRREDGFAVVFSGYLEVPAEGIYSFYVRSDDGSRLSIGSHVVINHDGLHSASERRGQIILQAGHHPIQVAMFEAGGAQYLEVSYEGPSIARQPIPPRVLFHSQ